MWVSLTWDLFGDMSLDGCWIGFVGVELRLVLIGVEMESEEQKELMCGMIVGARHGDCRGVGIDKGKVSVEIRLLFPCPCESSLCIEKRILSSFV